MPRGGVRPGAGRPAKAKALKARQAAADHEPSARPKFGSAKDFAVWALNAPDLEVDMDQKMRAMQALLALEAKAAEPKKAAPVEAPNDLYAPRKVRGFGVVTGGR